MALFAVITLVATVLQYSFLWILIPPLQDWTSSYIMRWGLIIFHGFFFSYLFCYYLTCTKDPGFCPPNWIPKVSKSSLQKARQRCKGYHRADYKMHFRFCSQCKIFKPPRTHHCTICQRCILRMDHHCLWIENCVGLRNHKYFLLFLLYLTITIGIAEIFLISALCHAWWYGGYRWYHWILAIALSLPFNSVAFVLVFAVLLQNLAVILHNKIAIEILETKWAEEDCRAIGIYRYPYDRGLWGNICDYFGPSVLLWFIPIDNITLSGLDFDPLVPKEMEEFEETKKIE